MAIRQHKVRGILLLWTFILGGVWSIHFCNITISTVRIRLMSISATTAPTTTTKANHTNNTQSQTTQVIPKDKRDFRFILEPWKVKLRVCDEDPCVKAKEIQWRMVIFVKSAFVNFFRRELLRRTWASLSYVDRGRFDTVFVIAGVPNRKRYNLLKEEHSRYGDILYFDESDDYNYVSLKTLAGMRWAASNLQANEFYASADDDFMIKMDLFAENINHHINQVNELGWPEFPIICGFKLGVAETPNRKGKWTVTKDNYRWDFYPPYCHGGLYATSVHLVQQLYNESLSDPLFSLDDVWITGIIRRRLGMPDEMLIKPKPYFGQHLNNYAKVEKSSNIRDFMRKEWVELYQQLSDNDICRYQANINITNVNLT
nr:beta-1,3-galactosyltransferase brn-like [Ciona intestinalis]|eukprot:XP_002131063.1 beta-1,3-galactosyltransferase brn-like [Ciona intestinalis]